MAFAVFYGFWLEGGHLWILFQPIEWLIILGLAYGSFVFGNPTLVVAEFFKRAPRAFLSHYYKKDLYHEAIQLVSALSIFKKRHGPLELEKLLDDDRNQFYEAFPLILKEQRILEFTKDAFRSLLTLENTNKQAVISTLDSEIDTYYKFQMQVARSVGDLGESMPAFGIVAAILGIILAMANINSPPDEIGRYISVALVGTFTGIALGYGLIKPIANSFEHFAYEQRLVMDLIRRGVVYHMGGIHGAAICESLSKSLPQQARLKEEELSALVRSIPK